MYCISKFFLNKLLILQRENNYIVLGYLLSVEQL